jgi:enoyl-CoA hydratase
VTIANDYESLLVEEFDTVVRVTLNRPEVRNAISTRLQRELIDAIERCSADQGVNVVIIRGSGSSFCSGYDISATSAESPRTDGDGTDTALVASRRALGTINMARAWSRIWNAHVPVIAQVHGNCLAGGTDLAQQCDIVIAAEDAVIGYPALRMGGTPPVNMWLYNVGPQWAKRLLYTGDTVTGRLAARIGLVLEAVPAGVLDDHVMSLAKRIALVGRDLVAINKFVINRGLDLMGRSILQEIAPPMDTIANLSPEMSEFTARAKEIGLGAAFKERDARFGDRAPLDVAEFPEPQKGLPPA